MWQEALLVLNTAFQLLTLVVLGWGALQYIQLRHWVRHCISQLKMDCDELIDQLLEMEHRESEPQGGETSRLSPDGDSQTQSVEMTSEDGVGTTAEKRERLVALAAGGQARQYLGRPLSTDQIDNMPDGDITKLYARYEAYLGSAITKTLGTAALQLYTMVASTFLPIPPENQPKLAADLEADPFVGHALSTATCELYHRYGRLLAPLTAALTTAKHCRFGDTAPHNIAPDDGDGTRATAGTAGGTAAGTATEGDPALIAARDKKV